MNYDCKSVNHTRVKSCAFKYEIAVTVTIALAALALAL